MEKADDYLDLEVLETQGEEGATKIVSTYLTIALNEVDESKFPVQTGILPSLSPSFSLPLTPFSPQLRQRKLLTYFFVCLLRNP